MIIFGWGKTTTKRYGESEKFRCGHCGNIEPWSYKRYRTWITLFFIPVIPYKSVYVRECPVCRSYQKLDKQEFLSMFSGGISGTSSGADNSNGDGLTQTQRNYKEEMARVKERNEQ